MCSLAGPSGSASPRVPSEPQAALRRISLTRYDETSDTITAVYKFVPAQDAPRVFSKLKLVAALDAQGLWSAFRDWMVEQDYYDLFLAAQEFREDHPSFSEILNATKTRFNLADDQTAALLNASVADS